ncbi:MAG: hypothetical protein ACI8RD_011977 [Bacillariaceae sp.]|jgi:hypothetical protein
MHNSKNQTIKKPYRSRSLTMKIISSRELFSTNMLIAVLFLFLSMAASAPVPEVVQIIGDGYSFDVIRADSFGNGDGNGVVDIPGTGIEAVPVDGVVGVTDAGCRPIRE